MQRLDTTIARATTFGQFAADEPLNLANRTGKSSVEQEYDERLATAQRAHKDAEKALADKRRELVARQATEKDLARILPTYEVAVTRTLQELNKISAQRYEVKDAVRNQASLFGVGISKRVRDLLKRAEALSNAEKRQAAQQLFLSAVE